MRKIVLVFSLLVSFLFSFSYNSTSQDSSRVELLSVENNNCGKYDSIVNITTTNNSINVSGFIVHSDINYTYIATSSFHYEKEYNYEIIFSDYSRHKAIVQGVANDEGIMVLRVDNPKRCSVRFSKSALLDKLERVDLLGMYNYQFIFAEAYVNATGLCKNCKDETYKKYYYTLLNADINNEFIGTGVFDKAGQLVGMVTSKSEKYILGVNMLDVDKIYVVTYHLIEEGKYDKNYIKYNLLDVNSLTKYEKYLYSLDEDLTDGVLISSIHYLNYFTGGLNQGMVIVKVNNISVKNCYELDKEFSKYKKGSKVELTVRKISGHYKVYRVKL